LIQPAAEPSLENIKDSVILDFEWFANTSDYSFNSSGEEWYQDFGWNSELFPEPTKQLKKYLEDLCGRDVDVRRHES